MEDLSNNTQVFTPAMILMVYAVARKIMPPGFAFLSALAMLSAPSMYYSRFYPFFCVLFMYLLIEFTQRKRAIWAFGLGISLMVGFFFKPEVALFSALISGTVFAVMYFHGSQDTLLVTAENGPRLPRSFILGIALLFTGMGVALSVYAVNHGIPKKFFNLLWESYRVWGNPFPEVLPFFNLLREIGWHRMFERLLFYLLP